MSDRVDIAGGAGAGRGYRWSPLVPHNALWVYILGYGACYRLLLCNMRVLWGLCVLCCGAVLCLLDCRWV